MGEQPATLLLLPVSIRWSQWLLSGALVVQESWWWLSLLEASLWEASLWEVLREEVPSSEVR
jgi:hypothetical protein